MNSTPKSLRRDLQMIANQREIELPDRRQSAVLALGGGGARGLAHFGAIQSVQEAGFEIVRIVGTSMGSLVGAVSACDDHIPRVSAQAVEYVTSDRFRAKQESLCGAHPKPEERSSSGMLAWYDRIKSYLWSRHLLSRVFSRRSLLSSQFMEEVIDALVPDIDISETEIPFSIVTVDLRSGRQVVLEHGSLRKAVLASAAIPGIFPPVEWDGLLLCDIGVLDSLPSEVAKSYGASVHIGVDVGPALQSTDDCESALHVLLRMDEIGERLLRRHALKNVDVLIRPEVGNCQWFDFSDPDELIQNGLRAGRHALAKWRNQRKLDPPSQRAPLIFQLPKLSLE